MKVFHGIIEIAGQMGILSGGLKRQGHIAVGYNTFHTYLGYQDHLLNTSNGDIKKMFKHIINFYDIFHFHYGASIEEDFSDLKAIKNKGKKMIMHHWGNDVRFHDMARVNNPYVYTGDSPPNREIHHKLNQISQFIPEAIVQDYEVLPYVEGYYKKVHVLPIAIDLDKFIPVYPSIEKKKPLILHAPTNPSFKGTTYIEKAINDLKKIYDFDYKRLEKINHNEVIKLYRDADIIVDQVCCGSHGLLSVESMALGKPVITYIRSDLVKKFPHDLPIVNGNPDNLKEKIEMLLNDSCKRHKLGKLGRKYVQKYHCRDKVTKKLLSIYSQL